MKVKLNNKMEMVNCEVAIDGYLHTVSYQADTTAENAVKVLQFTDHVVRIINKDILDTSGIETTFGHDGQNFNSTGWRNLPDDNGDKASDDMKSIYYAIEKGEFMLK